MLKNSKQIYRKRENSTIRVEYDGQHGQLWGEYNGKYANFKLC